MSRRSVESVAGAGEPERVAPDVAAEVEALFRDHHLRLFRALYLMTGDKVEADDLVQDAFARVWQRWDRVREMDDRVGYLYRTAMNAFRSRWRRLAVERRHRSTTARSSDPIEGAIDRQAVLAALRAVPPRQRLALVLTDFLDRTPAEAAAVLGVQEATARSLASQARARIRREVSPTDD